MAPQYDEAARQQLKEVLYAVRHLLTEATGGLPDSRTGQDLLPMLLQGRAAPQRAVDFSRFHTAALWLGPTLVAAGAFPLRFSTSKTPLSDIASSRKWQPVANLFCVAETPSKAGNDIWLRRMSRMTAASL